ncbi:MAG: hypothetical protein KTQ49_02200, partial [Candidatus Omnitrophica bacterium]|nr:hypothetical protein [Candidatus Omnitrophota bacterium]
MTVSPRKRNDQKKARRLPLFLTVLFLLLMTVPASNFLAAQNPPASPAAPEKDDESLAIPPVELFQEYSDVKIKIAENFRKVATGKMTPEAFYKALSLMEMPDGLEHRHLLMQVKKEIGDY